MSASPFEFDLELDRARVAVDQLRRARVRREHARATTTMTTAGTPLHHETLRCRRKTEHSSCRHAGAARLVRAHSSEGQSRYGLVACEPARADRAGDHPCRRRRRGGLPLRGRRRRRDVRRLRGRAGCARPSRRHGDGAARRPARLRRRQRRPVRARQPARALHRDLRAPPRARRRRAGRARRLDPREQRARARNRVRRRRAPTRAAAVRLRAGADGVDADAARGGDDGDPVARARVPRAGRDARPCALARLRRRAARGVRSDVAVVPAWPARDEHDACALEPAR